MQIANGIFVNEFSGWLMFPSNAETNNGLAPIQELDVCITWRECRLFKFYVRSSLTSDHNP
jgi:hypothetical protein